MPYNSEHKLARYIDAEAPGTELILAGSLGPGLTLKELIKLSTDPAATTEALNAIWDMKLAGATGPIGTLKLRERIADLYHDQHSVQITAEDVITTNATTGANLILFQTFLSPDDHVVTMYPTYGALLEMPAQIGAKTSYWHLDPSANWTGNLSALQQLLATPKTKLLILNNPHNPTGSILSTTQQKDILHLAAQHNVIVHSDEIFRPLMHDGADQPTSIVQHDFYDRTIATGSVSKSWCFSGLRLGWCVTRNPELKAAMRSVRGWILEATSMMDELIATEVLTPRCREPLKSRISSFATTNLSQLRQFISKHSDAVHCALPAGGSTAFVKFSDPTSGREVDDVEFCRQLKKSKGVLLAPGSLCFGTLRDGDFKGYVRVHLTCLPEIMERGLRRIEEFMGEEVYSRLASGEGKVNGTK